MNNDKEIIIDLKESLNPETFNETSNILQRDAFARLTEIVEEHKKQLPQSDESGKKSFRSLRSHNSVFISGARGSGKTTFLLNIKTVICDESTCRPYILDIIDPTLIHDNDNFLSIVLGRIADTVKKRSSYGGNDGNGNSAKEFFNKLSEVAELSEAISNSQQSTGLDNILDEQNALNLEIEIHNLMGIAVKVLNRPFLILPIDDIDMSFVHGFEVLEKIRKYLATPYIMPVISGDIEMYHQIFTVEFFRQMTHNKEISDEQIQKLYEKRKQRRADNDEDKNISDNNGKPESMYFISKSYILSDRYLEKVLPRNRRITLKNVQEIIKEDVKIKIAEEHPWNDKCISDAIAQIKKNFNLHCGYATRENNVFDDGNAPVPTNNLREILQFLDQTKDAFTDKGVNFPLLNKRIMDFYEFGGTHTDRAIFDFAKANYAAYDNKRKFSIKRFAKTENLQEYFSDTNAENKLVAFYPKPDGEIPRQNNSLENLFYIITFEKDIRNGSKIFISPDKFFLWITAKLFSPSDISQDDEKYSFGFDNKIFMNDNRRVQETYNIADDSNDDSGKRADDYEKIKYEELTNKDIFIKELTHFDDANCSTSFIYYMYTKFRKNVDEILSYMKISPTEYTFATLAKKLIIVYANAFAWASIQSKRFSENNICLKVEKISELKARDMAFKWNINAWKRETLDGKNEIYKYLQNFIRKYKQVENIDNADSTDDNENTNNLFSDFINILLKIFGLEEDVIKNTFVRNVQIYKSQQTNKQNNRKIKTSNPGTQIKRKFTTFLKDLLNAEWSDESELAKGIIDSEQFKNLKNISAQKNITPPINKWLEDSIHVIEKLPPQVYDTITANLGIK